MTTSPDRQQNAACHLSFPDKGTCRVHMDSLGFEPRAFASQRRRSTADLRALVHAGPPDSLSAQTVKGLGLGGDPAARSRTATLLRLSPPREARVRISPEERPSPEPHSVGLTGGVCKEQGLIHRLILRGDYYGFRVHEGGFQPSIPTTGGFRGLPPPLGVGYPLYRPL